MTASETTTLLLAGLAIAAGAAVAVGMWGRAGRRHRATRARHPSVRPPILVDLASGPDGRELRVELLRGAPPLSIDIVSYRAVAPDGEWDSLPIVDPIPVEPGVPTTLPLGGAGIPAPVDVVVAWTAHHTTGDVPTSQLFRIPAERDVAPVPTPSGTLAGWPALVLLALLALAAALVVRSAVTSDEPSDVSSATSVPIVDPPGPPASDPSPPPTEPTVTTPAATTPTTSTATPTTDAPTTSEPAPTSAPTSAPTGTAPDPTVPPTGPQVLAAGRIGPCRFADECLIVGFRLDGFTSAPQQYVCEFEDGSRFTFNFDSGGVEQACATGSTDAAITVEVDGVRSATVTRADAG